MKMGAGEKLLNYAILIFFSALAIVPLIGVLLTALTPQEEGGPSFSIPSRIDFSNFSGAWTDARMGDHLLTTAIVTVSVVVAATILSILAGFAFARMDFPGSKVLFYLAIIGLLVPQEAYVIPLFFTFRDWGLTDNYLGVILPQVAQSLAFGIFWMRATFRGIPESLLEAGRLDGASTRTILWRILVPPAMPAIITMIMLVFMWTWNDFLLSLIMLPSQQISTAPLSLTFFQGRHLTNFPMLAAAATIVALPIVIVYIFMQRHFLRGMLGGAVKG